MKKEETLKGLEDLIFSLHDKEKTNSEGFRERWLKKKVSIDQAIAALNKEDFDWLSSEWAKKWKEFVSDIV